jgi:hypothetical protein
MSSQSKQRTHEHLLPLNDHTSNKTKTVRSTTDFRRVDNLLDENKENLARILAAAIPHPTVQDVISKILAR